MTTEQFDAIIIGAGQGGGPLASALARAGRLTALIERAHVGGTCINEGCTPTKTMVASARAAYLARRGADYGVVGTVTGVDLTRVRERKRGIVHTFREGSERRVARAGVNLIEGDARFSGVHSVVVESASGGTLHLSAPLIFINTGERPSRPAIAGQDEVAVLDSTSIMELDELPRHLVVLGGGYIGLEFGQMFRRFGSAVTIIQRGPRLLAREDADISDAVAKILREDGIDVLCGTQVDRASPAPEGGTMLTVHTGDATGAIHASHVLAAVGRTPNTDTLNAAAAGVALDDRGCVVVNDRLETTASGIYAIGDVKGGPAFTHVSYDDFRVLRTNLLGDGGANIRGRLVPYTVFIDPQLGRVGMSESQAVREGREVLVASMPMTHVARALEVDESRGMMKAVVDAASGEILGATVLGLEGGEVMSMLQIAMMGRLPYTALRDAVFAHPTLAESLNNLFRTLEAPVSASQRASKSSHVSSESVASRRDGRERQADAR